jgi:hypothetical protein
MAKANQGLNGDGGTLAMGWIFGLGILFLGYKIVSWSFKK